MPDRVIIVRKEKETERVVYRDRPVCIEQKKPEEPTTDHEVLAVILCWIILFVAGIWCLAKYADTRHRPERHFTPADVPAKFWDDWGDISETPTLSSETSRLALGQD